MPSDKWSLYALMLKSRLFEEAIAKLWHDGLISGEMHLGTGEEAIIAGVVSQLRDGDAMALDHRSTAALLMRGADPVAILHELLGRMDGLCGGKGGHMHLFFKKHLAASSGIVGASGPAAAGFALAAQHMRPNSIAVCFFGESAMNQGMLMESLNLASVWSLPVLFVCKDDGWAITTQSQKMTGGNLKLRTQGFGIPYLKVDGLNVIQVWDASHSAIHRTRSGKGPTLLHANCVHLEGHFLGYQLLKTARRPVKEMPRMAASITKSFLKLRGASWRERASGLKEVLLSVLAALHDPREDSSNDPVIRTRKILLSEPERLQQLEDQIQQEMAHVLESALEEAFS